MKQKHDEEVKANGENRGKDLREGAADLGTNAADLESAVENAMTEEQIEEGLDKATEAVETDEAMTIMSLTNDLQRTRADFENFRRRVEERQEATKQAAKLATVFKILPLLDDLGRAFGTYKELEPLQKSLDKTLAELDLKLVEAKPGEEFNPDYHDAVSVEGEGEKEVVAEVLREGYYYGGELLRPAMVKVKRTE